MTTFLVVLGGASILRIFSIIGTLTCFPCNIFHLHVTLMWRLFFKHPDNMCYETKWKLMTICWWRVQTYHHSQHQIAVERDPKRMTKAHTPFDGLPGPKLQCVPISMDGTIIIIIYNYLWWWFLPTLQHWISECNHKNHYEPILSHQKPAASSPSSSFLKLGN